MLLIDVILSKPMTSVNEVLLLIVRLLIVSRFWNDDMLGKLVYEIVISLILSILLKVDKLTPIAPNLIFTLAFEFDPPWILMLFAELRLSKFKYWISLKFPKYRSCTLCKLGKLTVSTPVP